MLTEVNHGLDARNIVILRPWKAITSFRSLEPEVVHNLAGE